MVGPRAQRIQWFDNLGHCSRVAQETEIVPTTAFGKGPQNKETKEYTYTLELTEREKLLFILAGRLHDIGKQGRNELFKKSNETDKEWWYDVIESNGVIEQVQYKFDNETHCYTGFSMLLNKKSYRMCSGEKFDFDALFKELDVTPQERAFIAVLVGIHFSFGNVDNAMVPNPLTIPAFIGKLQDLINEANYNDGILTKKILHLAILIQVADIRGLCPCCCTQHNMQPVRQADVVAPKAFGYEINEEGTCRALEKMHRVLSYFDTLLAAS